MKNNPREYNKYGILDAFRCFFFLVVIVGLVSLVLQVVLAIIANTKGILYGDLIQSDTVSVVSSALSSITMIVFFFAYNGIRRIKNREAVTDGEKLSLLPISIAIVLAIICIFLFTPLMNLIDTLFASSGYAPDNTIPMQDKMTSSGTFFLLGLVIYALLPAIGEELIFRGLIQTSLSSKYKGIIAMLLTTIMFVLMHGSLQQTVYQFIVGIMLSYLALVGGSIVYSMILHFLNNALVLVFSCFDIVSYLNANETVYYNIFSMIFPVLIFMLGVVLVGILFWVLKYLRNKNFFRLDERGKFVTIDREAVEAINRSKTGFKGFFSTMSYTEKIYFIMSFVLVGIIWLTNTLANFA